MGGVGAVVTPKVRRVSVALMGLNIVEEEEEKDDGNDCKKSMINRKFVFNKQCKWFPYWLDLVDLSIGVER